MDTGQATKQQIYQVIETLPPESLGEISALLTSLKFKYHVGKGRETVALGGLWSDIEFDLTDADVRGLRQNTSRAVFRKG